MVSAPLAWDLLRDKYKAQVGAMQLTLSGELHAAKLGPDEKIPDYLECIKLPWYMLRDANMNQPENIIVGIAL